MWLSAQVSASGRDRPADRDCEPDGEQRGSRCGDADPDEDEPGRGLRPACWGISSLFGGRALGGAALREDALRQYGAAAQLRPRLPEFCETGVRACGRRDYPLAGWDDDGPRAWRILRLAGRGYRSR